MEDLLSLAIPLAIFLGLMCLGLFVGGTIERRHFQNLREREARTDHVLITQVKTYPMSRVTDTAPVMLVSEVVISSDYLKSFLGGLRNIFGGEVRSFQTLLERARREAQVRLKEEALQCGHNALCNVRIETADIAGRSSHQKNKIIMASILASATAYTYEPIQSS